MEFKNPCSGCASEAKCAETDLYCARYRAYITDCWARYRAYPRRMMDTPVPKRAHANFVYAHPDRVRDCLREPPCGRCRVRACHTPCLRLREWEAAKFHTGS